MIFIPCKDGISHNEAESAEKEHCAAAAQVIADVPAGPGGPGMNRTLLGMLTPSSNTVLEPVTTAILAGLPDVTAHFGRFRVTEIAMNERALGQFQNAPMLAAADLLSDAKPDVICWNGTSAGWLGFQADEELSQEIEAAHRRRSVLVGAGDQRDPARDECKDLWPG